MLVRKLSEYKRLNPRLLLFYDIYDLWPETFPSKIISNIRIWKMLRDNYIGNADHVFLECRYYKKFLKEYVRKEKMSVLYLTKKFETTIKTYPNRDKINFLYLGSINTIIDIDSIIVLLSKVSMETNVCIHIIGDGERRNEFVKKLDDNNIEYKYYGIVYDENQKRAIYGLCHFALNIYKKGVKIGLTMKSLDYFQNGLPVISMNIVDTGKLIKKYKCGYCLNSNNIEIIARTISRLEENQWLYLSRNTFSLMEACFSEDAFWRRFSNIMDKMMQLN